MRSGAVKIALLYIVVGILWIALSDKLLLLLQPHLNLSVVLFLSSIKGICYVIITGALLYHLITRHTRRLAESEFQFRSYFDDNTNPMFIIDRRTFLITAVNNAAVALYGYTKEELLRMSVLDLRPPETINKTINAFRELKKDLNDLGIWKHRKKNGVVFDVHITCNIIGDGSSNKVMAMSKDVNEVQKLERQNQEYLSRLEDTLDSISDAFFTLDQNLTILSVNTMFETLSGLKRKNIVNTNYFTELPPVHGSTLEARFREAIDTQKTVKFEEYSHRLNRWLRLACYPTSSGIAVYATDITESKEKDLRLKETLERYDMVAQATQDMLYELDVPLNKVLYVQSFGHFKDIDLVTEDDPASAWIKLVHPDDVSKVTKNSTEALSNKDHSYSCEYRLHIGDEYRYVLDQANIIYSDDMQPLKIIGAVKDINDLVLAGAENRRLGEVVNKISNMVFITDELRRTVWVNRAFEEFTGYRLADVKGKVIGKILVSPDAEPGITAYIISQKENRQPFSIEMAIVTQTGEQRWVFADYTPLFNGQQQYSGYIAVYSDISTIKEKEVSLQKQNAVLREIAWSGSHELRKPLATIQGLLAVIGLSEKQEEKEQCLTYMKAATEELDEMIRKFNSHIQDDPEQLT